MQSKIVLYPKCFLLGATFIFGFFKIVLRILHIIHITQSRSWSDIYIAIGERRYSKYVVNSKKPPWPIWSIKMNNPLFRKQAKVNFHATCSVSIQESILSRFSRAAQSGGKDMQFLVLFRFSLPIWNIPLQMLYNHMAHGICSH